MPSRIDKLASALCRHAPLAYAGTASILPVIALLVGASLFHAGYTSYREVAESEAPEWSGNIRVGLSSTEDYEVAMALDNEDNVHLAWEGKSKGGTTDVYYAKLSSQGEQLIRTMRVSQQNSRLETIPSVAVDSQGNAHLVWYSWETNRLHYSKIDRNGNILIDTAPASLTGVGSTWPALHIDDQDRLFLTMYSYKRGEPEAFLREMDLEGHTIKGDYLVSNKYDYVAELGSSYLDNSGNFHFSYMGTKWEDYLIDVNTDNKDVFYHRLSTDFLWFDDIHSHRIGGGDFNEKNATYNITVTDYRPGETWYLEGELDPWIRGPVNSSGTIEMAPPGGDYVTIGRWEPEDLRIAYFNIKRFDVTDLVTGPGEYRVRWTSDDKDDGGERWVVVTTSRLYTDATLVPRTQVSFSPELNSGNPEVIADGNGNAYVFWEEFKTESSDFDVDIHMSVLDPEGAILVNTTRISMSDRRAWDPHAIIDEEEIHVIWSDTRGEYYINTVNTNTFENSGESLLLLRPFRSGHPMGAITTKGDMIVVYTYAKNIAMRTQDVPPLSQGDNPANIAKGAALMAVAVAFIFYFKPYRLWKKAFASG